MSCAKSATACAPGECCNLKSSLIVYPNGGADKKHPYTLARGAKLKTISTHATLEEAAEALDKLRKKVGNITK